MKKISLIIFLIFLSLYLLQLYTFRSWRNENREKTFHQSKLFSIENKNLEYRVNGNGLALLWFHGVGGGFDQMDSLKNNTLISVSRPGYLRTNIGLNQSYAEQVYIYKKLLDYLNIDEVIVVGFSAGGPSAIAFAEQFPKQTKALILISAITKELRLGRPSRDFFDNSLDLLFGDDFSTYLNLKKINSNPFELLNESNKYFSKEDQELMRKNPSLLKGVLNYINKVSASESLRFPGFVNDRNYYALIGEKALNVVSPTLIIHGTKDSDVPFSHASSADRRIDNSKLVPIQNAGHYLFLSRWEEVNQILQDFLTVNELK